MEFCTVERLIILKGTLGDSDVNDILICPRYDEVKFCPVCKKTEKIGYLATFKSKTKSISTAN